MKKYVVLFLIVVSIILLLSNTVHAAYAEPLPENKYGLPYMIIIYLRGGHHAGYDAYQVIYTSRPLVVKSLDWFGDDTGVLGIGVLEGTYDIHLYEQKVGAGWREVYYDKNINGNWTCTEIVNTNYSLGVVTFELEENQSSFIGIDFDYSWFFGDLKLQIGKKEKETGQYKIIKEWQYPKGSGHVSIPAEEIPQGNKGEYIIIIYEGDTIIGEYPYKLNVEEGPYCEISYPVNGQSYNYYPNVNIRYKDMGILSIYINGEMYKRIFTEGKEGIEVIEGNSDMFDLGQNTVSVRDYYGGQVVATVQYEVLREGPKPKDEIPEFEAESWVKGIFSKIMNEYSMFFEYVRGIYAFLPVEILGLVVIIMMLSVILWFTGRK